MFEGLPRILNNDFSLLDIENQNSVVSVTIKSLCCNSFVFSHLDKHKPCLANGYPNNVSSWPEFVVLQMNMYGLKIIG